MEASLFPVRQMDNEDVVYGTYVMGYCSVIKILSFVATQMDLENIMLSEISQTEKDNLFMISLICGM